MEDKAISNRSPELGIENSQFYKLIKEGWAKNKGSVLASTQTQTQTQTQSSNQSVGSVQKNNYIDLARGAKSAKIRREKLAKQFSEKLIIVYSGAEKPLSHDSFYPFKPDRNFLYLTGLGANLFNNAILVIYPGGKTVLYANPPLGTQTDGFVLSSAHGEYWTGPAPSLEEIEEVTNIETRPLDLFCTILSKEFGSKFSTSSTTSCSTSCTTSNSTKNNQNHKNCAEIIGKGVQEGLILLTSSIPSECLKSCCSTNPNISIKPNGQLLQYLSNQRLIKDDYEIEQITKSVAVTLDDFNYTFLQIPKATKFPRGERFIQGSFDGFARTHGNGAGFETIVGAGEHGAYLHWVQNIGPVKNGDLLLLDAGVEIDSGYSGDITRTVPINGKYSKIQEEVANAVVDMADASFKVAVENSSLEKVHNAAIEVMVNRLNDWGLLPKGVSIDQALDPKGLHYKRWMFHGIGHHLGLDIHDCPNSLREDYWLGKLKAGMVHTIEPGIYFRIDDTTIPEEFRGIGIRCEDNVLITKDGNKNLSANLPRRPKDIEVWLEKLWS